MRVLSGVRGAAGPHRVGRIAVVRVPTTAGASRGGHRGGENSMGQTEGEIVNESNIHAGLDGLCLVFSVVVLLVAIYAMTLTIRDYRRSKS